MPGLGAALGEALGPVTDDDILAAFGMRRGKPAPSLGKAKVKFPKPRGNEAYWRERLAGQGSIKATPKTLGSVLNAALASGLTKAGVDERHSSRLAQRATSLLNDATPVGNAIGAEEGGRQFYHGLTKGDLGQMALGAGTFGLSVIPGSAAAKKVTGNVFGKMLADEAGAIRAWHGSPHDFDRFDMSKIGTGEGAQAYGHGLYFAENKKVAEEYRDELTKNALLVNGVPSSHLNRDQIYGMKGITPAAKEHLAWYVTRGYSPEDALKDAPRHLSQRDVGSLGRAIESGRIAQKDVPGRLYEVNINAEPEDFLDWDRPLSEQSKGVRKAYKGLGVTDERVAEIFSPETVPLWKDPSGNSIYRVAPFHGRDPLETKIQERNAALLKQGIPGIRYLDQGSRQTGGTSNYVVFDDQLINILNKY